MNKDADGCKTKPGMRGGKQEIKAGSCQAMNLVHEFMHTLGKSH
jgi:hypothetical protein